MRPASRASAPHAQGRVAEVVLKLQGVCWKIHANRSIGQLLLLTRWVRRSVLRKVLVGAQSAFAAW